MRPKTWLPILFFPALALQSSAAEPRHPNIVLIYADDLGYGDVGCYGTTAVKTPHIDSLAETGLRFTSGYASSATCTPSRYSMLTGEYSFRKDGTGILPGDAGLIIEPGRSTLPAILKKAGYTTGIVGKWHLGLGQDSQLDWNGEVKPGPLEVGFDYSFIMAATGDRVPCVYIENHHVVGLTADDPIKVSYQHAFHGEPTGQTERDTLKMDWSHGHNMAIVNGIGRIGYMQGGRCALWQDKDMADAFIQQALAFIERSKDRPFFLYFATHDIHVPRMPHPRFDGATTMGPRGDAIAQLDHGVGAILGQLGKLGLNRDTLVIFTSDNGPVLDDGYKDLANEKVGTHRPAGPWRAGKYSLFEGGTRMPFIISWPGRIKPGVSDAIVSQVDFCASFAALTGQTTDPAIIPDSIDVLPALLGKSAVGREHVLEHAGEVALREGKWKYLPAGRVRDGLGPWHLVTIPASGALYDLSADPGETRNLATSHPERVATMHQRLVSLRRKPAQIQRSSE